MPDDFVINVRQIAQYPAQTTAIAGSSLVLQNGVGGPYYSITPSNLVSTALLNGSWLRLVPGVGIAWNGAALTYEAGTFAFSEALTAPSFSTGSILIGGVPAATTAYADELTNGVVDLISSILGGTTPLTNSRFVGQPTAPTPDLDDYSGALATTEFVWNAIVDEIVNGHPLVYAFNGRKGWITLNVQDIKSAGGAPIRSPWFRGFPRTTTPPVGDVSNRVANTAFVAKAISLATEAGVSSFNGRQGHVMLLLGDVTNAGGAPQISPVFTGNPTAPTPPPGDNTGNLATTAFVQHAIAASTTGVASFNGRTGTVTLTTADVTTAGGAPIASPALTGTPTAPTAGATTNTTQIATTAFVQAALLTAPGGVSSFNTRTGAIVLQASDVTGVGGALLASPAFSGTPTAPTAAPSTSTTQLATTAFVTNAIAAIPADVTSFNGRTGAVTLNGPDISAAGGALTLSPALTGTPSAPTAAPGTSSTQIATTAFVQAAVTAASGGVTSFNTRTGVVTLTSGDVTGVGGALIASPNFTGTPSGPTAAAGTNSTQLATTAFVTAAIAAGVAGAVSSFNGRTGAVTLQGADISAAGGALLASPQFTGVPTVPTAAVGTNTTQAASTAFVDNAVAAAPTTSFPAGTVMLFWQAAAPLGWTQVTTQNDKLLRVVSNTTTGGTAGGSAAFSTFNAQTATSTYTLTTNDLPSIYSSYGNTITSYVFGQSALNGPYADQGWAGYALAAGGGPQACYTNGNVGNCYYWQGVNTIGVYSSTGGGAHSHAIQHNIAYIDLILASKQ